jgi:glycosyltransferase involved in cell wall biosynthesis
MHRLIREARSDLVHVNDFAIARRSVLAAAWLAGVPVVCHVRSLAALEMWDRLWARTVRRFIFISKCIEQDLAAQGIPADRGQVIYNGLDPDEYTRLPDRGAVPAALGATGHAEATSMPLPSDVTLEDAGQRADPSPVGTMPTRSPSTPDARLNRPTVAVVGRLVPWKGQDLFLRAMRTVVDSMPEAQGLIVGEAEEFSRDFGDQLRQLRGQLGLDAQVSFLGHVAEMPVVYAAIDLLAHTSVTPEPFGRVVIEAMACGLPVVTPAEGGGVEIVVDGVTGLHVEPRNPDALAAAILELLRDPSNAKAMGAAGRERVRQFFSLDRLIAEMTALYREISPERQHSRM